MTFCYKIQVFSSKKPLEKTLPTSKNTYTPIKKHTDIPLKIKFSLLSPNCILCNMFIDSFLIVLYSQSIFLKQKPCMSQGAQSTIMYL